MISQDTQDELFEMYEEMIVLYVNIKRAIQNNDPHLYERWKAGGFIIDPDIISMYPDMGKVIDSLEVEDDPDFGDGMDDDDLSILEGNRWPE